MIETSESPSPWTLEQLPVGVVVRDKSDNPIAEITFLGSLQVYPEMDNMTAILFGGNAIMRTTPLELSPFELLSNAVSSLRKHATPFVHDKSKSVVMSDDVHAVISSFDKLEAILAQSMQEVAGTC